MGLALPFPVRPDTILVIKFGKMIEVKNGNLATKNTFQLIHLCEKLNAESKVRQPLLDKSLKSFEEVRVQYQLLVKCLSQLVEVLEAFVDASKSGSGQLDWLLHLFSLERKSNVTHFS